MPIVLRIHRHLTMPAQPTFPLSFKKALQKTREDIAKYFDVLVELGQGPDEPVVQISLRPVNRATRQTFGFRTFEEAEAFLAEASLLGQASRMAR